jgi:hypothetical protein
MIPASGSPAASPSTSRQLPPVSDLNTRSHDR